jgi:hypothetical protein
MRLGNSGGKNKGKKYLKITGNELITPENRTKAERFTHWFGQSYILLQRELIRKGTQDEDMMNETFLRIYDKILFGGLEIADYKAYFHRAFFTNYMQNKMKNNKIIQMHVSDQYAVELLDENIEIAERENEKRQLCNNVLDFVKEKFDMPSYDLFVAYLNTGQKSYQDVVEQTHIPYETVALIISGIKRKIKSNRHFMSIRKAM